MSLKTYSNIIVSVNLTLFLSMRYITFLFPLIMGTSSFLLYIIFIIIVEYMTLFNSCGVIFHTLTTSQFYLAGFLVSSISFLADYLIQSIHLNFGKRISENLQRNKYGVNDSCSDMNSLVDKRDMVSKIFQMSSNLGNKVISRLSDFSLSKTDGYIDDYKKQNSIIPRTRSLGNKNRNENNYFNEKYSKNKRHSEITFSNKFKDNNFLIDDKKNFMYKVNQKWVKNSHLNLKNIDKKN